MVAGPSSWDIVGAFETNVVAGSNVFWGAWDTNAAGSAGAAFGISNAVVSGLGPLRGIVTSGGVGRGLMRPARMRGTSLPLGASLTVMVRLRRFPLILGRIRGVISRRNLAAAARGDIRCDGVCAVPFGAGILRGAD